MSNHETLLAEVERLKEELAFTSRLRQESAEKKHDAEAERDNALAEVERRWRHITHIMGDYNVLSAKRVDAELRAVSATAELAVTKELIDVLKTRAAAAVALASEGARFKDIKWLRVEVERLTVEADFNDETERERLHLFHEVGRLNSEVERQRLQIAHMMEDYKERSDQHMDAEFRVESVTAELKALRRECNKR